MSIPLRTPWLALLAMRSGLALFSALLMNASAHLHQVSWPTDAQSDEPQGRLYSARGDAKVRGTILCLHGIQTDAGWFEPLAEKFTAAGFDVIAMDRRGSGMNRSPGRPQFERGYAASAEQLLKDLEIQIAKARLRGHPVYVLATSWSSNLAGVYVLRAQGVQPDGLIQLVPATKSFFESWGKNFEAWLGDLFFSHKPREVPFKPDHYQAGDQQPSADQAYPSQQLGPRKHAQPQVVIRNAALTTRLEDESSNGALLVAPTVHLLHIGLQLGQEWRESKAQLQIPMLLLTARRDQIMINHEAYVAAIAHTQHDPSLLTRPKEELPEAGHGAQIADPAEVSAKILLWIDRLQVRR